MEGGRYKRNVFASLRPHWPVCEEEIAKFKAIPPGEELLFLSAEPPAVRLPPGLVQRWTGSAEETEEERVGPCLSRLVSEKNKIK